MLAGPTPFSPSDAIACDARRIRSALERYNAMLRARVGDGALAVLALGQDVNRIAAAAWSETASPDLSIAARDRAKLKELFEPCLEGGIRWFPERFGNVLTLEDAEVLPCGPDLAAGLVQYLGTPCTAVEATYSLGDGHEGVACLIFSNVLAEAVPEMASQDKGEHNVAGSMSQDEVNAMLREIGPNADAEAAEPAVAAPASPAPKPQPATADPRNLDMVLDIRLTATARLGRVEMPIGDILTLGPGSIIEVGHLVDEPVELLVNDKLIARGDVVVVDEKFGLRITEIISARERIESLR